MRSSKSRSRNKSNRNRSMGNIVNRVFDSSGPEGKVRGTPQQIIDKYNQLARDATLGNDRVAAENFQQHAEHYLRMLAEAQREQAERQAQQQQNQQSNNQQNGNGQQNNNNNNGQQNNGGQNNGTQPQPEPAQANGQDQAPERNGRQRTPKRDDDVIDTGGEDSMLVETPEEKPQRPRRTRRKAAQNDGDEASQPSQDAAE